MFLLKFRFIIGFTFASIHGQELSICSRDFRSAFEAGNVEIRPNALVSPIMPSVSYRTTNKTIVSKIFLRNICILL